VIETDGSLQLTYTGYLHLNVNSTINLIETNDSTNDDYQLNKGSIIEILFAFANCSFTEADITAPIQSND
jgi:hypothetical protein